MVNIALNYKLCGFYYYLKSKLDPSISPVNHAVSLVKYEGRWRYDSLVFKSNLCFLLFKACSVPISLNSNHPWCFISFFTVTEKNYPISDCHWNRSLFHKVWFHSYLVFPPSTGRKMRTTKGELYQGRYEYPSLERLFLINRISSQNSDELVTIICYSLLAIVV